MRVILFGATGMVGQGVLHKCLDDPDVELVLSIGRTPTGKNHPQLREIIRQDLYNYSDLRTELTGFDACFFCLGISSLRMSEEDYTRITYNLTLAAATILSQQNPQMTFIYVSGAGTDSSEKGKVMWARVKGKTENAILNMPFAGAYMFRPGFIEASYGETSKTKLYRVLYPFMKVILPIFRRMFPEQILTTEQIGQAMLNLTRSGGQKRILNIRDIQVAAKL